jgi:hypothetical protein
LQILRGFGDARQGCHIVARGKRQAGINSCAERCDDARGFAGRTVAEKPDRQDRRPLRARRARPPDAAPTAHLLAAGDRTAWLRNIGANYPDEHADAAHSLRLLRARRERLRDGRAAE